VSNDFLKEEKKLEKKQAHSPFNEGIKNYRPGKK